MTPEEVAKAHADEPTVCLRCRAYATSGCCARCEHLVVYLLAWKKSIPVYIGKPK